MLDDKDIEKPPYQGPNKDKLPEESVPADKVVEILTNLLTEIDETE